MEDKRERVAVGYVSLYPSLTSITDRHRKMKSRRKAREAEQSVLAINSGLLVRGAGRVFIRLQDWTRVHALPCPALIPFTAIRFSNLYFPL